MQWFRQIIVLVLVVSTVVAAREPRDLAPLLQRHVQRILTTQATDQAQCDADFAKNPYATYLSGLPTTGGLRNCIASNVNALLVPLSAQGAKCTLTSLITLLSANGSANTGLKAFSDFFNLLVSGLGLDGTTSNATASDLTTTLTAWTTDATKNEAFCTSMNSPIGPCVESLVPVIVNILDKKGTCCGQLSEFYELIKLLVPDGKTVDQTLVGLVNGLHRTMCTTTDGTATYCGQSVLSMLSGIVTTDKSLLSPLLFGGSIPLFALPDGTAACTALESTSIPSRVASSGKYDYAALSCCAGPYASLIQSFDDVLKQLTGNTIAETLNLVTNLQDAKAQFISPYKTLASCSFKTTCTNPSYVLTETTTAPVTSANTDKNKRPQKLKCTTTDLCNADEVCTSVCKEGTAIIDPWVARAVSYQRNLSYAKPLCYTQLPATHNSGTTLARGWGNRDQLVNKILDANNSDSYMRTNNQFLTLTDQLNLGARFIELDVHYFAGKIHDGHCSRINFSILDDISASITTSTQALLSAGTTSPVTIEWQASLMGCLPSLGGIRAEEARVHIDTVNEVAAWLKTHPNDFVFVYLDVGNEISTFKKYADMIALHQTAYGDMLLTPADLKKASGAWKTTPLGDLVKQGKRVAIVTGKDADGDAYFSMDMLCGGWTDVPGGKTGGGAGTIWGAKTNAGTIVRAYHSELHYATMSEDAISGSSLVGTDSEPALLNAATVPAFMNAGVNIIAPDGLDGAVVEAMVWSWAANEPSQGDTAVEISAKDGRWSGVKDKSSIKNIACVSSTNRLTWKIVPQGSSCPDGYAFGAPTLAIENVALMTAVKATGADATAQLNVDVSTIPTISAADEKAFNSGSSKGSGSSTGNGNTNPTSAANGQPTYVIPVVASMLIMLELVH